METKTYSAKGESLKIAEALMREVGEAKFERYCFIRRHAPECQQYRTGKVAAIECVCGPRPSPPEAWEAIEDGKDEWRPASGSELRKKWDALPREPTTNDLAHRFGYPNDVTIEASSVGHRVHLIVPATSPAPTGAVEVSAEEAKQYEQAVNTNRKALDDFDNMTCRIGKMIWLAGSGWGDTSDDLQEFIDDHTNKELRKIFPCEIVIDKDVPRVESVLESLSNGGVYGFLAQVETPVRTFRGNGVSSFSWGYAHTQWLYAETTQELITKAQEWAKEMSDLDKSKVEKAAS